MDQRAPSKLLLGGIILIGLLNLGRGSIHLFAPDGGLSEIAGLDISQGRALILFFIGAVGVGQITMGILDLLVALRYRALAFPLLLVHLVGMALGLFLFFVQRPLPVVVPGQYGAVVSPIIFSLIAVWELRRRSRHVEG